MKKIVFVILAAIVIFYTYLGVQDFIKRSETTIVTIEDIQEQDGVPVLTTTIEERDLYLVRSFNGSIKGIEQADVTSKIMERISEVKVSLGDRVKMDEVLIEFDPLSPGIGFKQASDALEDAKKDFERSKNLLDAGALSKQMHEKAELALKIAQSNFNDVLKLTEVKAPFEGTVTDIFYKKGETVAPGLPIIRIARLDRVISEIEVGETDLPLLETGQKSRIKTGSFAGITFEGIVNKIALSKDPITRNFIVEIEIPNPGHLLKPGMFAAVDLIIGKSENVLAVPEDAIVSENGTAFIYLVDANAIAKKVLVEEGIKDGEWIEVKGDINSGDEIVVEGHNRLSDGAKVIKVSQ
ncbi:efflux RND transporter periplasmic adaptor subunit [candidate division KSB1 bacterium]